MTAYLDEHLDDPDAADIAGGIPDPVLAEIGAERTGAMREIVATIQAEQDLVIRAPIDQVLVVQGGPGTGKTAVALHRAAYLLFEHRRRLARDGVLVIGPNRAFLDYVGNVLPSLGERSVRQCTVLDLCVPKVEITALDDSGRGPGQGRRADARRAAARRHDRRSRRRPRTSSCRSAPGASRSPRDEIAEWLDRAAGGVDPVQPATATAALDRPAGDPPAHRPRRRVAPGRPAAQGARRGVADAAADPPRRPPAARGPRPASAAWTAADQLLVDEANSILNGPPLVYGHVVVDEAQDHSAVALRVIGRRTPGSVDDARRRRRPVDDAGRPGALGRRLRLPVRSATDGGAAGTVAELTIGYRVPEPILDRRQPAAAADRRRRQRQPQRPHRRPRRRPGRTRRRPSSPADGRHGGRRAEAPPPPDRRRRPGRAPRGARRRARRRRAARRRPPPPAAPGRGARCSVPSRSRASSSTAWWSSNPTRSSATRRAAPACSTWR